MHMARQWQWSVSGDCPAGCSLAAPAFFEHRASVLAEGVLSWWHGLLASLDQQPAEWGYSRLEQIPSALAPMERSYISSSVSRLCQMKGGCGMLLSRHALVCAATTTHHVGTLAAALATGRAANMPATLTPVAIGSSPSSLYVVKALLVSYAMLSTIALSPPTAAVVLPLQDGSSSTWSQLQRLLVRCILPCLGAQLTRCPAAAANRGIVPGSGVKDLHGVPLTPQQVGIGKGLGQQGGCHLWTG